jgi:hypothetical protein
LKRYGENSFYFDTQTSSSEKAIFIDGMPSLFLAPVMGMRTFKDYCECFLQRKITKYFHESDEVHVLFDSPGIWGFNLKKKVQDERDAKRKKFQNCWLRKFWALLSFLALHHSGLVFLQIERIKEN